MMQKKKEVRPEVVELVVVGMVVHGAVAWQEYI